MKLNNLTDTIGYTYTKVQESVMMSGLLKLKITFTHFMTQIVMYLKVVLKFGHSEKHTKFEKIFHLKTFYLALLGIHRHPTQKDFLKSCEGFLRAALTVHGHPGPI